MAVWGAPVATGGRRRARRPCRARAGRRRHVARGRGRRSRPARACRRADRRGRRHARRAAARAWSPAISSTRPRASSRRPSPARSSSASRRGARPSRRSPSTTPARTSSRARQGLTPLWRALRVVSGARGTLRSTGLEAPFVGRDGELRLIKELFHTSAEEGRAHLVSVTGIAGIGKSRLAWEFYKYIDGLAAASRTGIAAAASPTGTGSRTGRSRRWCGCAAGSPRTTTRRPRARSSARRSRSTCRTQSERALVEPRLAHLLGLERGARARDRQDLFSAWRLFFERLAEV